ncbi:mannosyl-3-phosphoglycerate phosphatase-related protein [Martelella alba]|uniref:Mannosyl-3-phosphoglycerate phosphatase-related protein n=1 Tax=Martelella alba TaxID=2590451 RepID=A0ABY2SV55_9HYPH|nr:mannosyl-3-phosphoglycerate phosphatase-related protein [Martelella alba]TKI08319.1 mannosyl-3-phosphoglycerate phosphatase-related protein [Martelella alba]
MPNLNDPLLIITDLDGSLLDHHTYSWQPAAPWLKKLRVHSLPVVICSSKTMAEIRVLQNALGLEGAPFIAENGAMLHAGSQNAALEQAGGALGQSYDAIRSILTELRQTRGFKFFGFGDVDEKRVGEWTGLSPADAALAKQREASETLIWRDSEDKMQEFAACLAQKGLRLVQGGRFYHVMSEGADKGAAVRWLKDLYHRRDGRAWRTLGLGDGPNDIGMLQATDYSVIIRGYSKTPVDLGPVAHPVYRTQAYGPEGWNEGLNHFFGQTAE